MTRHADPLALGRGAVPAPGPGRATTPPPRRYRLWVMSDLAVDRHPLAMPDPLPDFDALVVAGDVSDDLRASVAWLARALDGRQGSRPVVLVPGNREFWGGRDGDGDIAGILARGRELASQAGIALLSDDGLRVDDGRGTGLYFLGATLWTDWALHGSRRATLARGHARHHLGDCRRIRRAGALPYLPHDAGGAHARSRAFIEDALGSIVAQATGFRASPVALVQDARPGDRAVVVTHHAPSPRALPPEVMPELADEWVGASLASDLEGIMAGWGAPTLWIHGSVPGPVDVTVGPTRIVSNPRISGWACGRPPFDPTFIVEV